MNRKILNCIRTINELDVEAFNRVGCGVELQDFVEPNLTDAQIEKLIEEYGNKLTELDGLKAIHGPFLDLKPSSPDKDIRKISQIKYGRTLQIAHKLDVDYVIFHSQINPYLNQQFLRDLNNRQAAAFWRSLMGLSPYKGRVVIENVFEESPYMLKELIDEINHDRIAVNLDIGHMNIGYCSLREWVEVLGDYVEYVHVHGNNGIEDQHITPTDQRLQSLFSALDENDVNPVLALEYKVLDLEKELGRYLK
ncbi:MAG: sugar phosphate isomerase/epimerase family protein [Bacillota bacterium]